MIGRLRQHLIFINISPYCACKVSNPVHISFKPEKPEGVFTGISLYLLLSFIKRRQG